MRIAYSDETGTGNVTNEPITVVAAVAVDAGYEGFPEDDPRRATTQWTRIHTRLGFLLEDAPPHLLDNGEIKGRRLLSRIRKKDADAWDLLANVATVASVERASVFYAAVDRAGLAAWQANGDAPDDQRARTSFAWAFRDCMDAVERALNAADPPEHIAWVHDEPGSHAKALVSSLRALDYERVTDVAAEMGVPHARILSPICFGHSHESRMLQLADVCCTIIAEKLRGGAYARLYDGIRSIVVTHGRGPRFRDAGSS